MQLDVVKQRLLDDALDSYAEELQRDPTDATSAVTLGYTHSIHRSWRTALRMLPVREQWSVLDVGCGLGVLAFELAANQAVSVHGVDIDARFIHHAGRLLERLDGLQLFVPGARVSFAEGDIHALDVADGSVDLLFVRELLQFLPDPAAAVRELLRVLKPGGYACVSDTDDQLYITWPPSDAQTRLVDAVTAVHRQRGGDRHTGRKLSTYLRRAGFEINSMVVLPEAQHRLVDATDAERSLVVDQLRSARERVVAAGVLSAEEYDAGLAELEAESPHEEFRMNASIIVLGQRPV